ncbi:MAG: hypothetical protein ACK4UN_08285, partial [Limisphaerales bacterium]
MKDNKTGADNRVARLQVRAFGSSIDLVAGSAALTVYVWPHVFATSSGASQTEVPAGRYDNSPGQALRRPGSRMPNLL